MKTKMVKKLTASLTAILLMAGGATYALATSAKNADGPQCPLEDKLVLTKLHLASDQKSVIENFYKERQEAAKEADKKLKESMRYDIEDGWVAE